MRARTFLAARFSVETTNTSRRFSLSAYVAASLGASAALLAACTSTPTAHVDTQAVAQYRATAYPIASEHAIQTFRIMGPSSETPWSATVTRPADSFRHPIVIYLPSLGQGDDEANHWVSAWAKSDYAVIVIQALPEDAQVWSSAEARSGDFERAAKARFRAELMADRIARLSTLLGQIRARSLRDEPGLQNLDWSEVALAGADLGAYTVQTIAATPAGRQAQISWPITPLGYLVISPYAVRNVAQSERAATVPHAPVLMISSADDIDADGIITDTSLRRVAFDRLGQGDDYYFELASATHRWLGGVISPASATEPAHHPAAPPSSGERKGKQRGSGSASRDAVAPDSEEDDTSPDKSTPTPAAARAELEKARSRALTQEALSEVSFATITTVFLDAYVRQQSAAHSWLASSAAKWLRSGDRLKHR